MAQAALAYDRRGSSGMDRVSVIKAGWIVAFQDGEHRILRDGVVAYSGDTIVHVGRSWDGPADEIIDAGGMLLSPGFISVHAHAMSHLGDRLVVDSGRRDLLRTGFLNYAAPRLAGGPGFSAKDDWEASHRYGFATLLRSGVTTAVQFDGGPLDGGATVTRVAGESGIRLYYAPVFNGAEYFTDTDGRIVCRSDEEKGLADLRRAAAYIERHDGAFGDRLRGILVLDELFNATPALLRRTKEAAKALGVGITLHASEQLFEFHEILRRTGKTPVGWMAAEGFLGPEVIVVHCVYISGHSLAGYPFAGDLEALAASSATVAHAPVALSRRGVALESFQRYRDHGVRLAIGTDSYPQDIIAEMRAASIIGKVVERNNEAVRARDVFDAATLGGAAALGRDDLGRIAKGAKADLVLVDFASLTVGPVRDPIRALVHCGSGELVDTVIVAGKPVVRGKTLLAWNEAELLARVRESAARVWDRFPEYHWQGASVEDVFGASLSPWRD
jgi:5-methylthioadenosine/S-adenosylhomocysteine deaminase